MMGKEAYKKLKKQIAEQEKQEVTGKEAETRAALEKSLQPFGWFVGIMCVLRSLGVLKEEHVNHIYAIGEDTASHMTRMTLAAGVMAGVQLGTHKLPAEQVVKHALIADESVRWLVENVAAGLDQPTLSDFKAMIASVAEVVQETNVEGS